MMIGVAPRALAARRETRPIGPAPLKRYRGNPTQLLVRQSNDYVERRTHAMTTPSPNLIPARSIPANATAKGSHRLPSSYETLSGSLWTHSEG